MITFVLLDIGSLLALLTTGALEGFRERLPTYQERFLLLSEQFGRWMEALGAEGSGQAIPELLDPTKVVVGLRFLLSNAGGFFATGLLVLLAVVFILLEANTVPAKLRAAFHLTGEGDARLKRLGGVIKRYMLIKSLTSLATAFCVWFWLYALGIDFVMLWTVLAFFLNFVPVVGNIVMMIPPVLIALVQTDLETTLLVAIGFLVINTGIGSVLEPRIMGKGLGISKSGGVRGAALLGLAVRRRRHVSGRSPHHGGDHRPGRKPSHPPAGHTAGPGGQGTRPRRSLRRQPGRRRAKPIKRMAEARKKTVGGRAAPAARVKADRRPPTAGLPSEVPGRRQGGRSAARPQPQAGLEGRQPAGAHSCGAGELRRPGRLAGPISSPSPGPAGVCSDPVMLSIAVRPERHSHAIIRGDRRVRGQPAIGPPGAGRRLVRDGLRAQRGQVRRHRPDRGCGPQGALPGGAGVSAEHRVSGA